MRGRNERERRRGHGWLATAAGTVLLLVLGFGFGLFVGVAWEAPELVLGRLAGRSIDVRLEPTTPPQGLVEAEALEAPPAVGSAADPPGPPVAATVPSPAPSPTPLSKAPRRQPPPVAAAPPRPAPAPPEGSFVIQVGAFSEQAPAQRLAGELRDKGLRVHVAPGQTGTSARWRVRVGPFASREEADRLAARLKTQERLPTWVLRPEDS